MPPRIKEKIKKTKKGERRQDSIKKESERIKNKKNSLILFMVPLFLLFFIVLYLFVPWNLIFNFNNEKEIESIYEKAYYLDLETALVSHEKVYRLELSNQGIEEIPLKIKELKDLRVLNLCNNNISEIPEEIGELTNLKKLYLCNNNLTSLPKSLKNLKKLEFLDIDGNDFTEEEINEIEKNFSYLF